MCCKNFGIGLIVLSITLFLGITVSEFFKLKDIPEVEVIEENADASEIESLTNCEPMDKDLKYQTLPNSKNDYPSFMDLDENQKLIQIPVPESSEKDDRKKDKTKSDAPTKDVLRNLEKNNSELHILLTQENYAENKNLLHKEICHDIENGRK